MRILHVADLHHKREWFRWVSREVGNYDVLVVAGDLLNAFPYETTTLPQQAKFVQDWLATLTKPAVICTGNHDTWPANPLEFRIDVLAEGAWLQSCRGDDVIVDGQSASIHGERFAAVKWGDSDWPDGTTIVVCHAPPSGTRVGINNEGMDWGDFEISMRIWEKRPTFVLGGHVHQPMDWAVFEGASWCFNPGCDMKAPVPNHIILDTTAKIASWQTTRRGCVTRRLSDY